MADLNFFLSEQEKLELIRQFLNDGCQFVPDQDYEFPNYATLNNMEECLKAINFKCPNLLFITHSNFSLYPFILDPIEKGGKIRYSIRQRYGGPSISLYLTGFFKNEDEIYLGHGFLSYYPYYYNPLNNERINAPDELKKVFKKINNWTNNCSVPYKLHSRTYRIGINAIEKVIEKRYLLRDISSNSIIELKNNYGL